MDKTYVKRFKRAWETLESLDQDAMYIAKEHGLNLMWLRNQAGLWVDYEECEDMEFDGINMDPNHPDNLSAYVWDCFKSTHQD